MFRSIITTYRHALSLHYRLLASNASPSLNASCLIWRLVVCAAIKRATRVVELTTAANHFVALKQRRWRCLNNYSICKRINKVKIGTNEMTSFSWSSLCKSSHTAHISQLIFIFVRCNFSYVNTNIACEQGDATQHLAVNV